MEERDTRIRIERGQCLVAFKLPPFVRENGTTARMIFKCQERRSGQSRREETVPEGLHQSSLPRDLSNLYNNVLRGSGHSILFL